MDANSPVPSGGSGGVLGYEFICDYFGIGQSNYVFGTWATDCMLSDAGVDPTWMVQVPTGNAPGYPTSFFPFLYTLPAFQNFDVQTGNINWYNSGVDCTINDNENDDGKLVVRLICCDNGGENANCQNCYYGEEIEMAINTGFQQGENASISLGGECGCVPE